MSFSFSFKGSQVFTVTLHLKHLFMYILGEEVDE